MNLLHVALVCSSEGKADRFYHDLLGLIKSESRILPASLSLAIFGIDSDLMMINYTNESVNFEIFVQENHPGRRRDGRVDHTCFNVDNFDRLLAKCRSMGVSITQVPKGQAVVTFIRDYDGNLFEIKQK